MRKQIELNDNENTTHQELYDAIKEGLVLI